MPRYVKTMQMGVSCIQSLGDALDEVKEAYENAMNRDVIELSFVDMTEEEFSKLPEFNGY